MAHCLDYAKIAYAAYFEGTNYEEPSGHMVDAWDVQHFKSGTLGSGFQGGIWVSDTDVVVSICGTNLKQKGKLLNDLFNDMQIGMRIMPNQASPAKKLVKMAQSIATSNQQVSVCGHSLGGGLAQIAGVQCGVPFVTFNAPAMKSIIKSSQRSFFRRTSKGPNPDDSPGVNFRIRGMGMDGIVRNDKVSMHFPGTNHVGMVVDLGAKSSTGAHGKNTCWQVVLATDWAFVNPFGD